MAGVMSPGGRRGQLNIDLKLISPSLTDLFTDLFILFSLQLTSPLSPHITPAALTSHLHAAFLRPSFIRLTLSKLNIDPKLISPPGPHFH